MKVGDFGMARYVGTSASTSSGTMSPTSPLGSPSGGPPTGLMRLSPGVIGTTQYAAPELINEDLRPQSKLYILSYI
jgi:serine/threonine protein kinase